MEPRTSSNVSEEANETISAFARVPQRIANEVIETAPAFVFFLAGFLLVLLVVKLFLAQYSIGFATFPQAVLGALFAAKAVIILDHHDYARLRRFPRVYAVVCKTAIYVLVVLLFAIAERTFHGYRETGSLSGGLELFFHRINRDRFFGTLLCVSIVFAAYFMIREVERKLGRGSMYQLFFHRPASDREQSLAEQPERRSAAG